MTKIKICGLTSPDEAAFVNEIHANFAGMIQFFEKSRRNIPTGEARRIMRNLKPSVKTVAVTVSPTDEQIRIIEDAGFDFIQIHGAFDPARMRGIRIPVIRAFNGTDYSDLSDAVESENVAGILFDAGAPGSGKTFDWSSLDSIDVGNKMKILAGGLNPDNVFAAVRRVRPDCVDVSSGVENDGGRGKNRGKILRFAEEVRRADRERKEAGF